MGKQTSSVAVVSGVREILTADGERMATRTPAVVVELTNKTDGSPILFLNLAASQMLGLEKGDRLDILYNDETFDVYLKPSKNGEYRAARYGSEAGKRVKVSVAKFYQEVFGALGIDVAGDPFKVPFSVVKLDGRWVGTFKVSPPTKDKPKVSEKDRLRLEIAKRDRLIARLKRQAAGSAPSKRPVSRPRKVVGV